MKENDDDVDEAGERKKNIENSPIPNYSVASAYSGPAPLPSLYT